jgi:hypothetical protein
LRPSEDVTAVPTDAPAVQVQPKSPANEAEQERLSAFDAKQVKRDEAVDKKLDICRC